MGKKKRSKHKKISPQITANAGEQIAMTPSQTVDEKIKLTTILPTAPSPSFLSLIDVSLASQDWGFINDLMLIIQKHCTDNHVDINKIIDSSGFNLPNTVTLQINHYAAVRVIENFENPSDHTKSDPMIQNLRKLVLLLNSYGVDLSEKNVTPELRDAFSSTDLEFFLKLHTIHNWADLIQAERAEVQAQLDKLIFQLLPSEVLPARVEEARVEETHIRKKYIAKKRAEEERALASNDPLFLELIDKLPKNSFTLDRNNDTPPPFYAETSDTDINTSDTDTEIPTGTDVFNPSPDAVTNPNEKQFFYSIIDDQSTKLYSKTPHKTDSDDESEEEFVSAQEGNSDDESEEEFFSAQEGNNDNDKATNSDNEERASDEAAGTTAGIDSNRKGNSDAEVTITTATSKGNAGGKPGVDTILSNFVDNKLIEISLVLPTCTVSDPTEVNNNREFQKEEEYREEMKESLDNSSPKVSIQNRTISGEEEAQGKTPNNTGFIYDYNEMVVALPVPDVLSDPLAQVEILSHEQTLNGLNPDHGFNSAFA